MSLINDMLRDLSDKQATREQDETLILADAQASSWEQEKIAHFFQQSRLPLIFISLIVFLVIFIFSKLILTQYKSSDSIAPEIKPISVVSSAELIRSPVINQDLLTDQPVVIPAVINLNATYSSDVQAQIYQLIDQASRAMTLDRLTSPENDNAYFYYQELLKLDAQNPVAIAGMNKITDRYLQMVEMSIQKNDFTKAGFFLDKAGMVTPNDIRIADLQNQLRISEEPNSVSVSDPFGDSMDSRLRGNDDALSNDVLSNSESVSNNEALSNDERKATGNSSLTITPNPEFLDEQRVKQARDWVAQGFKSKAIELLENHIQLYVAPVSEQYLLDLYYSDKNLTALQTLLNSNLKISTIDQTYYRARAAILQGDNQSAINLLESQLSEAAVNENYRALLAGLYQREQLYIQATSAYRNLLQSFNPKPAYWLGLALSLDAQSQAPAAIHAYKKILDFEQLEPQVIEYAKNRIVQLSRDH